MAAPRRHGDQLVVQIAAAVEADVDDDRFLAGESAEHLAEGALEVAQFHVGDMDVPNPPVREFLGQRPAPVDPPFVGQVHRLPEAGRRDDFLDHLAAIRRFYGQVNAPAALAVEHLIDVPDPV